MERGYIIQFFFVVVMFEDYKKRLLEQACKKKPIVYKNTLSQKIMP